MKRSTVEYPAIPRLWLPGLALALLLLSSAAQAQRQERTLGAEAQPEPPEESSQQVDESEESYRRSMELRDGFPGQQKRIETTYSKPSGTAKIDQLPIPSQKHIKDQMREMIIENGQWEPGQDLTNYPYEPSTAAQTDANLRRGEREAWSEELQKYQEREAAAYAKATGQSPEEVAAAGEAGQQGQPGQQGQSGSGAQGQQGGPGSESGDNAAAAAAERQARAMQAAAAYQGSGDASAEAAVSTAGVSESALGYLQTMSGGTTGSNPSGSEQEAAGQPGGQPGEQSDGQPSGQQSGGQPGEQVAGQPSGQPSASGAGQQAAQTAQANPAAESGKEFAEQNSGQEGGAESVAGTMAVDDLQNMYAASGQSSASSASAAANPSTDSSADADSQESESASAAASASDRQQEITFRDVQRETVTEPGTLTLEELRALDKSGSQ